MEYALHDNKVHLHLMNVPRYTAAFSQSMQSIQWDFLAKHNQPQQDNARDSQTMNLIRISLSTAWKQNNAFAQKNTKEQQQQQQACPEPAETTEHAYSFIYLVCTSFS